MMKFSTILNKYYDAENVVYITSMLQCQRYLSNGATEDLVDILYSGTKREDTLVFVFKKSPLIQDLYRKWKAHELG